MPRMPRGNMHQASKNGKKRAEESADGGVGKFKKATEEEHNKKMAEILTYLLFMVLFTISTSRGLFDSNYYYFGHNLANQLVGVEMPVWHSPQFQKTFKDVATVEEWYHWMLGPLIHTVYSPSTFDGDASWDWTHSNNQSGGENQLAWSALGGSGNYAEDTQAKREYLSASEDKPLPGYILGYGKLLGAVRISQLRSKSFNCNHRIKSILTRNFSWTCTGDQGGKFFSTASPGDFTTATEFTADFGQWSRFNQTLVADDTTGEWTGEVEVGTYSRARTDFPTEYYDQPLPISPWSNRAAGTTRVGAWSEGAYENGIERKAFDEEEEKKAAAAAKAQAAFAATEAKAAAAAASSDRRYLADDAAGSSSNNNNTAANSTDRGAPYGIQQFLYNGIAVEPTPLGTDPHHTTNGYILAAYTEQTVKGFRQKKMSSQRSKNLSPGLFAAKYVAPAYSVYLPPGLGKKAATQAITDLMHSGYVDLHTRALFVDLSVYNPMLDRIVHIRLTGELSKAGGLMPVYEVWVVRLWELVTNIDAIFMIINYIVAAFYCYYLLDCLVKIKNVGLRKFFKDALNFVQVLNILFFLASQGLNLYATTIFPSQDVQIDGSPYLDMLPIAQLKDIALAVTGVNVFLNWFKAIAIMSYSPAFAIINQTISTAAPAVGNFFSVFFIVMIGFTQAHTMIFNGKSELFKNFFASFFSLVRALLGDFDFKDLQQSEPFIGPLLFLVYISVAYFVVLNMLIAIISDAYELSRSQLKDMQQVDLLKSLKRFVVEKLRRKFCIKYFVICCCRSTYRKIRAEEERAKRMELASVESAGGSSGLMEEIDRTMEAAMEKMKTSNPSDLILVEWFDSLKQQEEELGYFHKEMDGMKKDIDDLKQSLDVGLRNIDVVNTGLAQSLMLLGTNLEEISGLSEHLEEDEEGGKKKSKKEKKAEAKAKKEEEKEKKKLEKEAALSDEEGANDTETDKDAEADDKDSDAKTPGESHGAS